VTAHVAFVVAADLEGMRLDRALRSEYPSLTREEAMRVLRAGKVECNHQVASYQTLVNANDLVTIRLQGNVVPTCRTHAVLHVGDGVIVVDKRPGVAMHAGVGVTDDDALTTAMAEDLGGQAGSVSILGRLDRPTSGIVVATATKEAHAQVHPAWQDGRAVKQYAVVVHGTTPDTGDINIPLAARRPQQRGQGIREEARTSYERLSSANGVSLLRATLHTGRMHQIRRHMKAIGHSVVGDNRYGDERADQKIVAAHGDVPLFLHAWRLQTPPGSWPLPSELVAPIPALWRLHGATTELLRSVR
jgi:RluA family pseudouridine synthase